MLILPASLCQNFPTRQTETYTLVKSKGACWKTHVGRVIIVIHNSPCFPVNHEGAIMGQSNHHENNRRRRDVDHVEDLLDSWLSAQTSIHFAILFGSFAKQENRADSDIDLAVELDEPLTAENKLILLQSLSELTDRRIDFIDLKTVGEPLLGQIVKYGRVLKGSEQKFIELSIRNVNMIQDFTPYIKRTLKEKRERWLRRG